MFNLYCCLTQVFNHIPLKYISLQLSLCEILCTKMFNAEKLEDERQRLATGDFRRGFGLFKGYTMPESFQEIQQAIEDFQVYDDDVWITSFPKCGTTWSQELVWCVLHDLNLETTKEETDLRMPFIE